MESGEKLAELLRRIKGVFDVPKVHFQVSVADEASRHLNLGGILDRNEFTVLFIKCSNTRRQTEGGSGDFFDDGSSWGVTTM